MLRRLKLSAWTKLQVKKEERQTMRGPMMIIHRFNAKLKGANIIHVN